MEQTPLFHYLRNGNLQKGRQLLENAEVVSLETMKTGDIDEEFVLVGQILQVKKYTSPVQFFNKMRTNKTYKGEATYDR